MRIIHIVASKSGGDRMQYYLNHRGEYDDYTTDVDIYNNDTDRIDRINRLNAINSFLRNNPTRDHWILTDQYLYLQLLDLISHLCPRPGDKLEIVDISHQAYPINGDQLNDLSFMAAPTTLTFITAIGEVK